MKAKTRDLLSKIYNDPSHPGGFSTADALWKATNKSIPKSDVINWLQTQDAYTLHRPIRKRFRRNKYVINNRDDLWQADINDMQSLQKHNDGYKYLLTVIDVFSKYAWAVPLHNKTGGEVIRAFEKIILQDKRKSIHLQTDKGKEFLNKPFQKFLKEKNINYYYTKNPDVKASIVERFNRTLKTRMWRYFTYYNMYRYVDVLPQLLHAYNHTVHRSIKMAPAQVNETNILQVWNNLYASPTKVSNKLIKFAIGSYVRISKEKTTFEKGFEKNWSEEIFRIKRVMRRTLPVYIIEDLQGEEIEGTFYEVELQQVKLLKEQVHKIDKIVDSKGKGARKKVLVQWRGYPSKFNSWLSASQVLHLK